MKTESLQSTLHALQQLFSTVGNAATNDARVLREAERLNFPDPNFAVQVASYLQARNRELNEDTISEAFLALLLDPETQNPWVRWRTAIREAGRRVGDCLSELYHVLVETGAGFSPNLAELAIELKSMLDTKSAASVQRKKLQERASELDAWKMTLAMEWLATSKAQSGQGIDIIDVEALLLDATVMERLKVEAGPWEVLMAQARAHKSHRNVGAALTDLANNLQ